MIKADESNFKKVKEILEYYRVYGARIRLFKINLMGDNSPEYIREQKENIKLYEKMHSDVEKCLSILDDSEMELLKKTRFDNRSYDSIIPTICKAYYNDEYINKKVEISQSKLLAKGYELSNAIYIKLLSVGILEYYDPEMVWD